MGAGCQRNHACDGRVGTPSLSLRLQVGERGWDGASSLVANHAITGVFVMEPPWKPLSDVAGGLLRREHIQVPGEWCTPKSTETPLLGTLPGLPCAPFPGPFVGILYNKPAGEECFLEFRELF